MPNFVDNDLTITGKTDELIRFKDLAESKESKLDFNKFIPYPKKFEELDEIRAEYETKETKYIKQKGKERWSELSETEIKEFITLNGKPPTDGFNQGGYEWRIENWDTKWPACEISLQIEPTKLSYSFDTAWSPPIKVIKKMAELFPNLKFQLRYYEMGAGFKGNLIIKGTNIVKDESSDYHGSRGG